MFINSGVRTNDWHIDWMGPLCILIRSTSVQYFSFFRQFCLLSFNSNGGQFKIYKKNNLSLHMRQKFIKIVEKMSVWYDMAINFFLLFFSHCYYYLLFLSFIFLLWWFNEWFIYVLTLQATARGFLIVLALSIHDFFEGIALGVETSTTATYFLLAAFASHKVVISGTVGLNWARSQVISNNPYVKCLN